MLLCWMEFGEEKQQINDFQTPEIKKEKKNSLGKFKLICAFDFFFFFALI